jgi:hypothetical protein
MIIKSLFDLLAIQPNCTALHMFSLNVGSTLPVVKSGKWKLLSKKSYKEFQIDQKILSLYFES